MDNSMSCMDVRVSLDNNRLIHQLVSQLDSKKLLTVLGDLPNYVIYGNQSTLPTRLIHFLYSSGPKQKSSAIQKIVEACKSGSIQPKQLPLVIQPSLPPRPNPTQPLDRITNETKHFAHDQPFFKVINTLLKPMYFKGNTDCINFNCNFFGLEIIKDLTVRFEFKIILRLERDGLNSFKGRLPYNVKVSVNNCELPVLNTAATKSSHQVCDPIDITKHIFLNTHVENKLNISWSNEPYGYVAGVYLIKKLTWENLLVELQKKPLRASEKTKELIQKSMESEADVGRDSLFTTIIDPITKLRMKLPARGDKCIHLQCFDAILFLQMNDHLQTWECPVCKKHVKFETMEIDEFFLNIIQSQNLSKECKHINLLRDGTWAEKKN